MLAFSQPRTLRVSGVLSFSGKVRMAQQGLIQVYTGPGKGKTTAALGLIVRALGHGRQVLLVRLLKGAPECGELRFLAAQPGVTIMDAGVGVIHGRPDPEQLRRSVLETLAAAERFWREHAIDLLILDEINNALHRGTVTLAELQPLLARRPAGMEVVLTGRNAPAALLEQADLVTYMENRRHPLERGIAARAGVEY